MVPEEVTEVPAYAEGAAWARENVAPLRELFNSGELSTPELRTRLFETAARIYPSRRGRMENDLNQTAFVAGAFRALTDLMPLTGEGAGAVFETALEMGSIWSAERAKYARLEELAAKPRGWWRARLGDASPNDVVNAASSAWWREQGRGKRSTSRYEILIDRFGAREMAALATVRRIDDVRDGPYRYYRVRGEDASFDIMAEDVRDGRILVQGRGDLVG